MLHRDCVTGAANGGGRDSAPVPAPPIQILVVEDHGAIREHVSRSLQAAGYRVTEAADADEALRLVGTGLDFDLLLTDVEMPGTMDGIALARHLTSARGDLPVVITSGGVPGDAVPSQFAFLAKPFRLPALFELISSSLGRE